MLGLPLFRVHLLSILIVMNGVITSFSQTDCNDTKKSLQVCMDKIKPIQDNPDLAFPENDADITRTCRYVTETVDCLNNFADRCLENEQKEPFLTAFSGFHWYAHNLCTPGSQLRESTLKHRSCYKSVAAEHNMCIDKFSGKENTVPKGMSDEEIVKEMCCSVKGMIDCLMIPLVEKCDKEAADLSRRILDELLTQSASFMCNSVDHSKCSAASSITMHGFFLLIPLFIAVLKH